MKKHKISRAAIAALSITSALAFSACEGTQGSRGNMPDDREEETTPTEEPVKPAEDPTPTPEVPAEDEKIPLTSEELNNINNGITTAYNGFFTCSYCCPEMIDWGNVCYDGAGIDTQLSEEELDKYLGGREIVTGITAIREKDLQDYCRITTGTDYSTAIRNLDWSQLYTDDEVIYVHEHGDTNYMQVTVNDGYKEGDIYHLFFNVYDTIAADDRDFEMTARVTDDGKVWNFISNMPKDEPTQAKLLNIDYYAEDADFSYDDMIYVSELPSDEPAWCWAVITAEEDNTLVVIDHADVSGDYLSLIWEDIFVPGDRLYSTTLNKGENFAIRVTMAWTPVIHLGASRDGFEAEYWFGEDNWRHNEKADGTPASHPVIGYDRDAMGCGLDPQNVIQFFNMLDGSWLYVDDNAQPAGFIRFTGYGNDIMISNLEESVELIFNVSNISGTSTVGDGICIQCTEDDLKYFKLSDPSKYLISTYQVEIEQLKDGQVLTLTPVESDDDIINMVMSYPDEAGGPLEFYRYNTCAE